MKKIIPIVFLTFSTFVFSQNAKLRKGIILIDNKPWAKYEGCGMFDSDCSFFLGENEIAITRIINRDFKLITKNNTSGAEGWDEVKFLGTNKSFETKEDKYVIAQLLYMAKVLNDNGSLNELAINKLVEKYGKRYSDKYHNASGNNNNIIIIK